MGRKNHRVEHIPDDNILRPGVELPTVVRTRWETREERDERIRAEFGRKRERNDRRTDRRVLDALVDWDTCCIPGCGAALTTWELQVGQRDRLDTSRRLPLCVYHETIVKLQVDHRAGEADRVFMRERLARRRVEEEIELNDRLDLERQNNGAKQGQIYVIRQGGLIKVGWSSKLRDRLKHYGAGVEILAHYPAARSEETALHRSLRPYLAKGREWYQDCKLLADVVDGIHNRHGKPTIFPDWTEPKPALSARPRGFPAA